MLALAALVSGIILEVVGVLLLANDIIRGPINRFRTSQLEAQMSYHAGQAERLRETLGIDPTSRNYLALETFFGQEIKEHEEEHQRLERESASLQHHQFWTAVGKGRRGLGIIVLGALLQIAGSIGMSV